jgi:hypothetical protein
MATEVRTLVLPASEVVRSHGGVDHYKVFADDESYHRGHGRAYEMLGIDPVKGCMVLCRPDQVRPLFSAQAGWRS